MPNHPRRKTGPAHERMTPEDLRTIIEGVGITQDQAAELAGVALRTMQQYLAGDRKMPLSASGLLCVGLHTIYRAPHLERYMPAKIALALVRW